MRDVQINLVPVSSESVCVCCLRVCEREKDRERVREREREREIYKLESQRTLSAPSKHDMIALLHFLVLYVTVTDSSAAVVVVNVVASFNRVLEIKKTMSRVFQLFLFSPAEVET